jgi:hypothetical protein
MSAFEIQNYKINNNNKFDDEIAFFKQNYNKFILVNIAFSPNLIQKKTEIIMNHGTHTSSSSSKA